MGQEALVSVIIVTDLDLIWMCMTETTRLNQQAGPAGRSQKGVGALDIRCRFS